MLSNKKKIFNILFISLLFLPIIGIFFINYNNLIMLIFGIFFSIVYLLFIYGEITSLRYKNNKVFDVHSDNTNLIIDYKNDRFSVPIDSFNYIDEYYKRATGKVLGPLKKEEMINYLKTEYWYFLKKIPKENLIDERSILSYFQDKIEINGDEKNNLLKYTNVKKTLITEIFNSIMFFFVFAIFLLLSYHGIITQIGFIILIIVLFTLLIFVLFISKLSLCFRLINFSKEIRNSRIYLINCVVGIEHYGLTIDDSIHNILFENKYFKNKRNKSTYRVIIKNENNYYLNKWFIIPEKVKNGTASLYVINNTNKNTFILLNDDLKQ